MPTSINEIFELYMKHPYDFEITDVDSFIKTNYGEFEAILDIDGKLYEAPNGHTEGLIKIAATRKGMSRDALYATCPLEFYADMITWGISVSEGAMPIWSQFYMGKPNELQQSTLDLLAQHGVKPKSLQL